MSSLEKKNLALEKELLSAKTDFNNKLQKLKEAEKRCSELQTSVQRFVVAGLFLKSTSGVCLTSVFTFSLSCLQSRGETLSLGEREPCLEAEHVKFIPKENRTKS